MKRVVLLAGILILCATSVKADVISDWNLQSLQSVAASTPPRRGPSAVLDFAKVEEPALGRVVQAPARRYVSIDR